MVITAISYPGDRLGWAGQPFVMNRIGMHTQRLSLHLKYKHVRSGTQSGAEYPFFPLNVMVACCFAVTLLQITHTYTHADTPYDANMEV